MRSYERVFAPADGAGAGAGGDILGGDGAAAADANVAGNAGGGSPADGAGSSGQSAGDFLASLPERLRADAGLAKFAGKSVADLATAYLNAQKLIGKPADTLLDPAQFKDDLPGLMQALGAPGAPEKYEDLGEVPADSPLANPENLGTVRKMAAAAHLLPAQAKALMAEFVKEAEALEKVATEANEKGIQEMRLEWGPDYEKQTAFARSAAKEFGLTEALNGAGLGSNPKVIGALAKIGRMIAASGTEPGSQTAMSPAAAAAQISALEKEAFDLRHTNPAGSKVAAARALELRRKIGPA